MIVVSDSSPLIVLAKLGRLNLLKQLYRRGYLKDLREAFRQLLSEEVYVDPALLNQRLRSFGLQSL